MSLPQVDFDTIGSVGSVIGAALESSGHYLQSEVLQILDSGLGTSLGAFIFVMGAVSAIFIYAVGGNYKYGLWFLVGVPLFFFIVNTRVPSTGARWQMGSRIFNQTFVHQAAYNTAGTTGPLQTESGETVQVSAIFAQWNIFTSAVVQRFVTLLDRADDGFSNLQFLSRGDRYFELFNLDVTDPKLKFFFDNVISMQCADVYAARVAVYDENIDIGRKERLRCQLYEEGSSRRTSLGAGSYPKNNPVLWNEVIAYRQGIVNSCNPAEQAVAQCGDASCPEPFQVNQTTFSCNELWDILVFLFKTHADQLINDVILSDDPELIPTEPMFVEMLKKFRGQPTSDNPFSSLPTDDTQASIAMINEVAARMILRQLSSVNMDATKWATQVNPETWNLKGNDSNQDIARSIRELSTAIEYLHKGNFITYVLSLPYLQGLGLFLLSLSFPFFAMAVIAPGHGKTMLLWFGLWFWIKSWDIGMAIVMVIDKLLYALLPHGPPLGEADMRDPGKAFKVLLEVDPAYSSFVYYNLLAACMAAIPVLTGILVQRGGQELMNAINQGFQNFGGRVGHSMSQYQRNLQAQAHAARSKGRVYNQLARGFDEAWQRSGMDQVMTGRAAMEGMRRAFASGNKWGGPGIAAALAKAESTRQGQMALQRFKIELAKEVYDTATDSYTRYQEGRLAGLGMFARRLTNEFYGDELVNLLAQSHNPNLGSTDFESQMWKSFGRFPVSGRAQDAALASLRNFGGAAAGVFMNESGEVTLQSVIDGLVGTAGTFFEVRDKVLDPEAAVAPEVQTEYRGSPQQFAQQANSILQDTFAVQDRALMLGIADSFSGLDPMYNDGERYGLFALTPGEFRHANERLGVLSDPNLDIFNPEHNTRAAAVLFRERLNILDKAPADTRLPTADSSFGARATAILTVQFGGIDGNYRVQEDGEGLRAAEQFVRNQGVEQRAERFYQELR